MKTLGIGREVVKQRGMGLLDFALDEFDDLILNVIEGVGDGGWLVLLSALFAELSELQVLGDLFPDDLRLGCGPSGGLRIRRPAPERWPRYLSGSRSRRDGGRRYVGFRSGVREIRRGRVSKIPCGRSDARA